MLIGNDDKGKESIDTVILLITIINTIMITYINHRDNDNDSSSSFTVALF